MQRQTLEDVFPGRDMPNNAVEFVGAVTRLGWKKLALDSTKTQIFFAPEAEATDAGVIRVSTLPDYGFYNYAQLSQAHPSPHFQKIADHTFMDGGHAHVTLSERLYPAPFVPDAEDPVRSELSAFWALANYIAAYTDKDGRKLTPADEDAANARRPPHQEKELRKLVQGLREISPTLCDAFQAVQRCQLWMSRREAGYSISTPDFGNANIMMRRNGSGIADTVVLADPFFFDATSDAEALIDADFKTREKVFGRPSRAVKEAVILPSVFKLS